MTCRCKAEFCYICSARWRTCSCTDAHLTTAQQAADVRRAERVNQEVVAAAEVARREAAAEEERIILQMVADFERAEAEREAAALEAQRLRDEEERRQREEERRLIEEGRIAAIGLHFHKLTIELEVLNEVQRVLMAERYEFEAELQRKERQDALDAIIVRFLASFEAMRKAAYHTVADAEAKYQHEYRTRLVEEQRIETQYLGELRAYWSSQPDGESRVLSALHEMRAEQDREYKFWDAYRKKQLFALKEGEKRKIERLIAKHEAEIKQTEGRAKIDGVEWKTRVWAEGRWVEEVSSVRVEMLAELEMGEYARV